MSTSLEETIDRAGYVTVELLKQKKCPNCLSC